jgi:hypothetical protein
LLEFASLIITLVVFVPVPTVTMMYGTIVHVLLPIGCKWSCLWPSMCARGSPYQTTILVLAFGTTAIRLLGAQVKLSRGRREMREAAALFVEARNRVNDVEPGLLGGLQRQLMAEVAANAAAYAAIAALESSVSGDLEDEELAARVEV